MKKRSIAWRIAAGVLGIVLAAAGAVPAATVCPDGCTCHRQAHIREYAHQPGHGHSHAIHGYYSANPNAFLPVPTDPGTRHPACRTLPVEICRMHGTRTMGVLQRPASGRVQPSFYFSDVAGPVLSQPVGWVRFFAGKYYQPQPYVDPPAVPLYLQHLSLIC